MKTCNFCGNKNIKKSETEYTYNKDGKYFIISNVPCHKCEYCGEQYFEVSVLKQIEKEFSNIYNGNKKINKEIVIPTENYHEFA